MKRSIYVHTYTTTYYTRFCIDSLSRRIRAVMRQNKVIFVHLINRSTVAAATAHLATGEKLISIRTVIV